jgi:hypothetical protein
MDDSVIDKYNEVYEIYKDVKGYTNILKKIEEGILNDRLDEVCNLLDKLNTKEELYNNLEFKVKNKSVFNTLKRIKNGKYKNNYEILKCFSSLFTHCIIFCEQGNEEYKIIANDLLNKINKYFIF